MTNNDKVDELSTEKFKEIIKEGTVLIDFFARFGVCLVL